MLKLDIFTPLGITLSETEVEMVSIPGIEGMIGVLPGHIPLITIISSGVLSYKKAEATKEVALHHGFAQIVDDQIKVSVKIAEVGDNIDIDRAKAAYEKSSKALEELLLTTNYDKSTYEKYHSKLSRAMTRIGSFH